MHSSLTAQVPDLTAGGVPTDSEYINLGPTGMEGWIYNNGSGKMQETVDARQILVTKVDAGSPADGILAVDDVILGADGTGAEPVAFTSDARKALAYAIDAAEGNNPAELKLLRWRSGVTNTVTITLEYLGGSYTSTAPYNCPKSQAILEKGLEYIMNNVTDTGYGGFAPTVLMAANDPSNPSNAARQARAQSEAYELNLTQAEIDDMTSGDLTRAIGKPWSIGPQLITQAEYYLQTGDSAVLPSIRARAIQIANAQSLFGTMGHHYSLPGPNGELNGPYGIGYGPVNNAGMPCFIGLILAEKCGLTDQEILDGIDRAAKYFQYYADLGTVPYGENKETGSIANNGKSGLNAIALGMLTGYESQAKYFSKLSVFGASERDGGHTGPYFNHLWTPLGANYGGQEAMANYFATTSWLYDLARRWDGDFVYQPYYKSGGIRGYGQGHKASWTTLLTYAAPLAQLHITGKGATAAQVLDSSELAHIDFAATYDPTTRTTNELIEDLKSPLPQLHWSAAGEIGANRSADHATILPTLIDMAYNGATYAERHGAIFALGKIADDSTAPDLAALCGDPNSKVRYMAANALSNLSMSAKTAQVTTVVNGLVANERPMLPLDPENPMHVEKMAFANLLFDSNVGIWGGNRVSGADRNLLYPAFRIIATAPMGVSTRDEAFSVAPYLTKTDVEELADVLVDVATNPPPGEISYNCRTGSITAMRVNNFSEGIPASVIAFNQTTKVGAQRNMLQELAAYAGSNLLVNPDAEIVRFCENLLTNSDTYDVEAQAVLDAIENDLLPSIVKPFKSIDWIFADDPDLTLPDTKTVLRLQWNDFAKGSPSFTWRKIHGAGDVSFTPNGTSEAQNTTVVFDGTPGVYTFEVTMADARGLTEAYRRVTVNLYDTDGTLPANTAPTADGQSITVGQGTPAQVVLTGSDPEGQELIFSVTDGPSQGHLSGTPPNLVYTANGDYTGSDSFTFQAMDTEGEVATATVNLTVDPVSNVGVGVYEPFDYPKGLLNGVSGSTEIGLDGSWTADSSMNVIGGSLTYGSLRVEGGSIGNLENGDSLGGARTISTSALAGNGLLDDGATLWFSAVVGHPGITYNQELYIALANDSFVTGNNFWIVDDGAQLGSGVGLAVDGGQALAAQYRDSSQGSRASSHVYGTWDSSISGSVGSYSSRLAVGKLTWGATSDTIEIYLPGDDMVLPSTPSSVLTVDVDQSTFDTLTFSRSGTPILDEIRFGATYQSVLQGTAPMSADMTAPTPDPMTFAELPAPSGPTSITMTATPAHDALEVEYYFACTAGGAPDSGWQDSNVYTATGLTAGVEYTFTVKARDKYPGQNETAASAPASATIPASATVPDVVGILQSSAEDLIAAADLTVGSITQATAYSLTVPEGHVLSQSPTGASTAAYGSAVDLEISIGQDPALPVLDPVDIIDDQSGGPVVTDTLITYTLTFSEDMDASTVDASDFVNVGDVSITVGAINETAEGIFTVEVTPTTNGILRFAIAEGASLLDAQGDAFNTSTATIDDTVITVDLPDVIVPDVVGLDQATAESNIVAANLVVGTVREIYDDVVPAGDVYSQDPVGGSTLPGQYSVNLVISKGPAPDTTGPAITAIDPGDGAYNFEANGNLTVTFNEDVFVNSGSIVISNLNDGTDTLIPVTDNAQVSTNFNVLTIDPTDNLVGGNSYAVRIAPDAVVDASGNGFAGINDNTTWNFSTAPTALETVLFSEDFEAPDVTAYSQGTTPSSWVGADQGFNATHHGLTDKAGGDFSAADPNHQAYAFRYGNTGITTAEGVLATVAEGDTYEVSFEVVRDDGMNTGTPYTAKLIAFNPGDPRNDSRSADPGIEMTSVSGDARTDGLFSTVTFQYTVPSGDPAIGMDLALRFVGASTSAIVDNVTVKTVSNPADPDQIPPAIAALTPADNARNASLTDNLRVDFDEDVAIQAGYVTLVNLDLTTETKINIVDELQILINGSSMEINPTDDLDTNTAYAVKIDPGALVDLAGNDFPGITDSTTWSFNTGEVTDTTAPTVLSVSPADGATAVSYRTILTLDFDENVVANTGLITLKNLTDATESTIDVSDSSQVSVSGANVTITPASYLGEGKDYAIQIDPGAFLDLADNAHAGISDDTTWNFTTSANNPPAIAALDPIDEAVGVDPGANLSITFDENVMLGSGNITLRNTSDLVDTIIDVSDSSQVSVSGQVLTINPASSLTQGKVFAVLMDAGSITDLQGNAFGGIGSETTWNFQVGVSTQGAVFYEDFEVASGSPDVNAIDSTGVTSKQTGPQWERASNGFGADRHGIVDESSGQFTDPNGEQAYAFRYTNSGITTVEGAIGALTQDATYSVSFYVVLDGENSGDNYTAQLVTFAPGALRNDADANQSMVLASTTGAYSGGSYELVTFEYTSNGVNDAAVLGHDVALRFIGQTTSANIDNIQVAVNGGVEGDTTAPTLAPVDIVDDASGGPVAPNTLVTYTLTFSEDMDETTVDASDFANAGSSAITIGSITESSPGVFTVEVTPTEVGSLQLSIAAGASLTDTSGNALDTSAAIIDDTTLTVELPPISITSITPSAGETGTVVEVDIDGSNLTGDCTVQLTRSGYPAIAGTSVQLVGGALRCNLDLNGAAVGSWTVVVTDPAQRTDSLVDGFSVIGQLWSEDFDSSPTGWVSEEVVAGNAWVLTNALSHSPAESYFAPGPASKTTTRLVSPTIPIPADGDHLQFHFWHQHDLEIGIDGGILEFSLDDGLNWFKVEDAGSGAVYSSYPPNATLSGKGNPNNRNDLDGQAAWTGTVAGFVETVVDLDPATYAGANLRARWTIGTDSATASAGWYVDTVSLTGAATVADTTAPILTGSNMVDDQAGSSVTPDTVVTYTLTFSEDVDAGTVEGSDFGNAGTAPVTVGAINETSAGVFSVEVTPTGVGSLQLQVNTGAIITDAAGNSLDTATPILDDTTIEVVSKFEAWAGEGSTPGADSNGDGISDGLAWVLGASDSSVDAITMSPKSDVTSDPNYLIFTFRRSDEAHNDTNTSIDVIYAEDMLNWSVAVHDGSGIVITETDDHYGAGVDRVEVKIAWDVMLQDKAFVRLQVDIGM